MVVKFDFLVGWKELRRKIKKQGEERREGMIKPVKNGKGQQVVGWLDLKTSLLSANDYRDYPS